MAWHEARGGGLCEAVLGLPAGETRASATGGHAGTSSNPYGAMQDLTMDFVEGLPKSEGYDSIMVVVDQLTKFAHFVPLRHPFNAAQVARVF